MRKLRWSRLGLWLFHWRNVLVCEFAGHDPRRRIQFDGRGGVWQTEQCNRCGGWLS